MSGAAFFVDLFIFDSVGRLSLFVDIFIFGFLSRVSLFVDLVIFSSLNGPVNIIFVILSSYEVQTIDIIGRYDFYYCLFK